MLYMPPENPASIETEWLLILKWQKGMVSADQAGRLGMTAGEIRWKVKSGKWQWMYRGVYATFSGELPWEARLWAVVLSIGDSAALSHETAAELHGFGFGFSKGPAGPVHVTVPLASEPARWSGLRGVMVHRTRNWQADPQPYWNLPRTPAARTVLDLVAAAPALDDAYAWLSRAVTRRTVTPAMIADVLGSRKRFARRAWLQDAVTDVRDGIHFPLERRWVTDIERPHGLPAATRQAKRAGADGIRYLDNYYEPYGLCVELDGAAFHPDEDRARDRRRDNETTIAASAETLRYGFKEVANRPCDQAEQFARALMKHKWTADTLSPCSRSCPVAKLTTKRHY
ncbi:MAG TPA: type IV toxin-antitoxin system AbiEi family antitoxin domain-containing protein [Trebonia sp.]|jgi:hypothetical protein|nr:type IV toxin-antitoxin system AbiEi family antitoxin domain-containing protein [Trebonia sp.]